jgi:DNA-binding LacI/PurR family transcriptional regulator
MKPTPKWAPPPPPTTPANATLPRVPFINDDGRYEKAADTHVAHTIARERKRIGALTGAQVRADRAARARAARDAHGKAQQPLELVTSHHFIGVCSCERCQSMRTSKKATR